MELEILSQFEMKIKTKDKGQRGVGQKTKQKQEVADSGIFHGRLGSISGCKEKKEEKGHL